MVKEFSLKINITTQLIPERYIRIIQAERWIRLSDTVNGRGEVKVTCASCERDTGDVCEL